MRARRWLLAAPLLGCNVVFGNVDKELDACAAYHDLVVASQRACPSSDLPSVTDRARFLASCNAERAAPGVAFDGAFVEACARAVAPPASPCLGDHVECRRPAGALPEAAPCGASAQCASGTCAPEGTGGCGRCRGARGLGESCVGAGCAAGTTCAGTGDRPTCVALGGLGERCAEGGTLPCAAALFCDPATAKCRAPLEAGEACDARARCRADLACRGGACAPRGAEGDPCGADGECALDLFCDEPARRCARPVLARPGELCDDAAIRCERGACARADYGPRERRCTLFVADGQPCPTDAILQCLPQSRCVDGACKVADPGVCR